MSPSDEISLSVARWLELRARRAEPGGEEEAEEEGVLADALLSLGGRAVEERDGWLVTHVRAPPDPETVRADAARRLEERVGARVEVVCGWRDVEDWSEAWKRGLAPRRISARLWVTPSWEEAGLRARLPPGAHVVVVDPGMAFGTAEHATTRGALRLLDRALVPGARVLDVGAGSAILSVAAALLGAAEIVAIEGDPVAGEYARENVVRNGAGERVRWVGAWANGDLLRALGPADGVLANLESGTLRRLLPGLRDALQSGGWLILSGVLAEEWEGFADEVARAGLARVETDADGEWRSGWFVRF